MKQEQIQIEQNNNIYHYDKNVEREKQLILNNKEISKQNKEIILQYVKDRKIKKGFTEARILKLLNRLKLISLILRKDFDKTNKEDIEKFLEVLNNNNKLSKATKVDYLVILKGFYKWFLGNDKKYPDIVEDISANYDKKRRLPSDILDEEDIIKMLNNALNLRDKAIISLLSDSGCRIGELINLRLKNLKSNQDGTYQLFIETGKTGGRALVLVPSVPYLSSHISSLPDNLKNDGNNYLFTLIENHKYTQKQMTYQSIRMLLQKIAKRSGVTKAVNPHSWRRYSATYSSSFMTDTQLMIRYGWKERDTIDAYTFMNPNKADEAYLKKFGKQNDEAKEVKQLAIKCFCGTFNPPDSLCSNCGKPNSLKIAISVQEEKEQKDNEALLKLKQAIEILSRNLTPDVKEELKNALAK